MCDVSSAEAKLGGFHMLRRCTGVTGSFTSLSNVFSVDSNPFNTSSSLSLLRPFLQNTVTAK